MVQFRSRAITARATSSRTRGEDGRFRNSRQGRGKTTCNRLKQTGERAGGPTGTLIDGKAAAVILGTLPVTAWAFGGHMGRGAGGHLGMGPVLVLGMNLGPPAASLLIDSAVARLLETATFSPIIVFSLIAVFSLIIAFSPITVFSALMRSSSGSDSPIPITHIPTNRIILTPTIRISRILKTPRSTVGFRRNWKIVS
jgi:hypothetical protein